MIQLTDKHHQHHFDAVQDPALFAKIGGVNATRMILDTITVSLKASKHLTSKAAISAILAEAIDKEIREHLVTKYLMDGATLEHAIPFIKDRVLNQLDAYVRGELRSLSVSPNQAGNVASEFADSIYGAVNEAENPSVLESYPASAENLEAARSEFNEVFEQSYQQAVERLNNGERAVLNNENPYLEGDAGMIEAREAAAAAEAPATATA